MNVSITNTGKTKSGIKTGVIGFKGNSQDRAKFNDLKRYISEKKIDQKPNISDETETKTKNEKAPKYINMQSNSHYLHAVYRNPESNKIAHASKVKGTSNPKCTSNISIYKKKLSKEKESTKIKNNSLILSMLAQNFEKIKNKKVEYRENVVNNNKDSKTGRKDLKPSLDRDIKNSDINIPISNDQRKEIKNNQTSLQKVFQKNKKISVIPIDTSSPVQDNPTKINQVSPIHYNPIVNSIDYFNKFTKNKQKETRGKKTNHFQKPTEKYSPDDFINEYSKIDLVEDSEIKLNEKLNKSKPSSYSAQKHGLNSKKGFVIDSQLEIYKSKDSVINPIEYIKRNDRVIPKFIEMFNKMYKEQETEDRRNIKEEIKDSIKANSIPETKLHFYQIIKLIGKGSFGKVYLGLQKLTNRLVAIKCLEKQYFIDEVTKSKIKSEVGIQKTLLGHPNVIKLLEVFENEKFVFFVLEYAANNDLLHYLKDKTILEEDEARVIFFQIASGVRYCHKQSIIHRDIKLDNILIDEHFHCKLCDFGVSRYMKHNEIINEQCGTPAYLAPEIVQETGYKNFGADIWSLGVLLYSIVTGHMPFKANTKDSLNKMILRGEFKFPEDVQLSEELVDLIQKMLIVNPDKRITIEEIFKHKWITKIDKNLTVLKNIKSFEKVQFSYLEEQDYQINEFALNFVCGLGFDKESLIDSVIKKQLNHGTSCYFLIEKDFI